MQGIIKNYRGGKRTQYSNQFIIEIEGIDDRKKACRLIGKKVHWSNAKKKTKTGKIVAAHGGKGAVRVRFAAGLPGQAIGSKVVIID